MKKSTIVDVISYLLILLFVYTGVSKLLTLGFFRLQLSHQPFFYRFAGVLAWAVPLLELLLVGLLLKGSWRRWGLYGSLFLMSAFTLYVAYMVAFMAPGHLPCSCGGVIRLMNWHQHLVFNITYTLLALIGIVLDRHMDQYNLGV